MLKQSVVVHVGYPFESLKTYMDAHLGVEPSPFASEAAVLETARADRTLVGN